MRIGVIGSFVWDVIYGRDPRSLPVEEWGGITYALSGLDAALPDDWEIVPVMKIGEDLATRARQFLGSLDHIASDASLMEVPFPNNRVELRYYTDERRSEILTGGVPAWNWLTLKPALEAARLDALYVNFLSGWELDLETTQHSRQRLPQIMRNVGADLLVRLQELLDSIEQPIEGPCERRQVVVCAT